MTVNLAMVRQKTGVSGFLRLCRQVGIADGEMTAVRFGSRMSLTEKLTAAWRFLVTKDGKEDRCS